MDNIHIRQDIVMVDKPAGWTSFDVVAKIRGQLEKNITQDPTLCGCDACQQELRRRRDNQATKPKRPHRVKVGHAGTLDPFATGLLILAVGKATKRISEYMGLPKTYQATIKLGVTTETLDTESKEQFVSDYEPTLEEVKEALVQFQGEIEQTPPKYSAIKIDGQRAYKLAREGKDVDVPTRTVIVHELELLDYSYPLLSFKTVVSKGTYVRTLAADLGEQLGSGAYCVQLKRTAIGRNTLQHQAITSVT